MVKQSSGFGKGPITYLYPPNPARLYDGVVRRTGRARREERVKAGGTQRLESLEDTNPDTTKKKASVGRDVSIRDWKGVLPECDRAVK